VHGEHDLMEDVSEGMYGMGSEAQPCMEICKAICLLFHRRFLSGWNRDLGR
jgi:hypothetical protein